MIHFVTQFVSTKLAVCVFMKRCEEDCLDSCSAASLTSRGVCGSREALSLILYGCHTNSILYPRLKPCHLDR